MTTADWHKIKTSKEDRSIIEKIVLRYMKLYQNTHQVDIDEVDTEMDVTCVHYNNPLRLQELLDTDDFNFGHDISGIGNKLNRETGELSDCFVPRFTK